MEDLLQGLDDEQRAVVAHREGPAIVIAGPGAGKTRTLTARTATLLQEGVAPEAIMLLTFTRASAQEMIRRASVLDQRAAYTTSGTFHSVGARIVNANAAILSPDGSPQPFTILDQEDVEQMVRKHLDRVRDGTKNWPRASTVSKVISFAVNAGISVAEALERKAPDHVEHAEAITRVMDTVTMEKYERRQLSYDDVLLYWAALLEDEVVGPQLRSRWSQILVDEAQDSNPVQLSILRGLAQGGTNIMLVGDPSQAIYGFRGSAPEVLRQFHDEHPNAKIYTISSNYRSTPEIVAIGAALDARIDTGFQRRLRAASNLSGARPTVVDVHDAAAEAEAIVDAILAHKAEGGEIKDHAVLVRSTAQARRLEAECISRKVPFIVRGGTRIDEAAHIRDLLCVARLAGNLMHEPAWLRLLARFPKIGDRAATEMSAELMKATTVTEAAQTLRAHGEKRRTTLSALADAIEGAARDGVPAQRLDRIVDAMEPIWKEVWHEDWKSRARDLEAVIVIAHEHATMEDFLTAITLDGSIDRENAGNVEKPDEQPLTISTIHGAKGLEWDHVHLPSFVAGGMPSMFANGPEDRVEELRIAFVAMTRPRKTLTLYQPRFAANGNLTSASEYLPMIAHLTQSRVHARRQAAGDARVTTGRRIDMRARLMGKGNGVISPSREN